jgi:hypothetical protein
MDPNLPNTCTGTVSLGNRYALEKIQLNEI